MDMKKLKAAKDIDYEKLAEKTVTVVGIGSVGSHVAEAMSRIGIDVRMVDQGRVKPEDLPLVSMFIVEEESKFKAKEAKKHIEEINPKANIKGFHEKLKDINTYLLESDLVIDCAQDWDTSLLINNYCKESKTPVIFSRVAGSEGLVLADKNGYAYTKLEPHAEKFGTVKEKGLLPSTVHMAASIILTKAFKILQGDKFSSKLFRFNSYKGTKRESSL